MNVKQYLELSIKNDQWQATNTILSNAKVQISWGKPVVVTSGYNGSISLVSLVKKISTVARNHCVADNFSSIGDRYYGILINQKLVQLYNEAQIKLESTNKIIKWFFSIRNLFIDDLDSGIITKYFRSHSISGYQSEFGLGLLPDFDAEIERKAHVQRYVQ